MPIDTPAMIAATFPTPRKPFMIVSPSGRVMCSHVLMNRRGRKNSFQ